MISNAEVFTFWIRAGEAISGQVFIPSSRAFTLQLGSHIGSGLNRLEFDTHSAATAVVGCLRFPASMLEFLQPFLCLLEIASMIPHGQEQQSADEDNNQYGFETDGEMIHEIRVVIG